MRFASAHFIILITPISLPKKSGENFNSSLQRDRSEQSGNGHGVLGNPRWRTPPSLPSRQRCQKDVSDTEREDGTAVIWSE